MHLSKVKVIASTASVWWAIIADCACFLPAAQPPAARPELAGAKATRAETKRDLTPKSFSSIHALVRPHEDEWRHLNVQWLTDVVAARKKAAAEDKPMVVLHTGGAGYNEPLGVC